MSQTISFHLVPPHELDSLPEQAIIHLNEASQAMKGFFPIGRALDQAKSGEGEMFLIKHGNTVLGAFFLNFVMIKGGVVMNCPLLGGLRMEEWGDALEKFLIEKMHREGMADFTLFGRKGWQKAFPRLEYMGTVFRGRLAQKDHLI